MSAEVKAKRLAIVGCGKMGRLVRSLAPEYGFEVTSTVGRGGELTPPVDVAIEFTEPAAAPDNIVHLARAGVSTVCGTTGWLERLDEVSQAVHEHATGLVWSANFSVGVAVFRRVVETAAELLKNREEYGAWAWEIHHDAKKDAPSGTLLALIESMRRNGYQRPIDVSASRAGKQPGTHEIGFDSAADTITLRHAARSREGFARGALQAAGWLVTGSGRRGVYTFEDVLFGKSAPRQQAIE